MKRSAITHRPTAWLLAAAMVSAPLSGCGKNEPPPPVDDTRGGRAAPVQPQPHAESQGMSGTQKVVLLAGAAALYYLYKHHQNATAKDGPEGQYYLSKNGRVYYRDAEHRAHWVTPPADGIKVPESEAGDYRNFQGFNNSTSGRDLAGLGADPE